MADRYGWELESLLIEYWYGCDESYRMEMVVVWCRDTWLEIAGLDCATGEVWSGVVG